MLQSTYTAFIVAHLFLDIVVKIHGMLHNLVSDWDPLFLSKFWQELFKLSGSKLRMSSAYHPQSDGQTEVLNRVIDQYLRSFVHQRPSSWGKFLLLAEWSYNTSIHTTTGMTPCKVTFGKQPPSITHYLLGTSNIDVVDDFLTSREAIFAIARKKLLKAQQTMKNFADTKRREVQFEVGDMVLVKLRQRRQTSVIGAAQSKLAKCYYGPFCILEKIGPVAYRLELPPHSRIYPVFHCSLLKPFHQASASPTPVDSLPPNSVDNEPIITPLSSWLLSGPRPMMGPNYWLWCNGKACFLKIPRGNPGLS